MRMCVSSVSLCVRDVLAYVVEEAVASATFYLSVVTIVLVYTHLRAM